MLKLALEQERRMSPAGRFGLSGAVFVIAWLVAWEGPILLGRWWSEVGYDPSLGDVGSPWVRGSDIISSVPFLYRALALGIAAVLIAEVGKGLALLAGLPRPAQFWALSLGFQVAAALDSLRIHAYDWLIYGASFLGLVQLQRGKIVGYATIWMADFPWLSLPLLLALLVQLRYSSRRRNGTAKTRGTARA